LSTPVRELLVRGASVCRREEPPRDESGLRAHGSSQRFHRLPGHAVARALTHQASPASSRRQQGFSSIMGGGARAARDAVARWAGRPLPKRTSVERSPFVHPRSRDAGGRRWPRRRAQHGASDRPVGRPQTNPEQMSCDGRMGSGSAAMTRLSATVRSRSCITWRTCHRRSRFVRQDDSSVVTAPTRRNGRGTLKRG
jgi:hypothetical protein